jgi:hypothetical protein
MWWAVRVPSLTVSVPLALPEASENERPFAAGTPAALPLMLRK